jgi:amino acid adenylation domain-containing protein
MDSNRLSLVSAAVGVFEERPGVSGVMVPALFATQVELRPQAAAVSGSGKTVSYAELDSWSSSIAQTLRSSGVHANVPVGLYFDSSAEMIAGALGVWKAGGAYLPIDPAYPAERAHFILSDSGAPVVLTCREHRDRLQGGAWNVICVEEIAAVVSSKPASSVTASADDLAYLIYTSGSTGQPKGVEITHGNLLNLVEWHHRAFSVRALDRATQIAGPGFDAAVWELWPYLAAGAAMHIPSRQARYSATELRDWLVAEQISISFVPTVLAEELLRLPWPEQTQLRYLLTGGDALHLFPSPGLPFELVNNYGPTECTVVATSGLVSSEAGEQSSPTIGRAILNTTLHVLDEDAKPVAYGEVGELYIGGRSVGRGYHNRPDLTQERFITLQVTGASERVFRTGDLVRLLANGELAFAGRADDQIKIRGFRIEPDEIAAAINRHPAVISSAVVARNDSGEKRLVAYLVAAPGTEIWDRELRDALAQSLPDYMVPASFVRLDRIPVTANGKLDKAALPTPTTENQLPRDSYAAPRTELEEMVEGIVGPILGLPRVSIYDNFFLLGGHSLMGAQVIAKVRDMFGVELNLRNVFESPTVAKLAAKIESSLVARLEAMSDEEVDQALQAQGDVASMAPDRRPSQVN